MKKIQNISIKNPCHENWGNMTDVANGKFCSCCQKTVTDFTGLTDNEIIERLSGLTHICGKFGSEQLSRLNYSFKQNHHSGYLWKKIGVVAAFLAAYPFINAHAKIPVKTEQIPFLGNENIPATDSLKIIYGVIIADDDKSPIPGVTIQVKGTNIGTSSGINGEFKINMPFGHDTLVFKYIGFEKQEVAIDKLNGKPVDIALKTDSTFNSKVSVIAGGVYVRYSFIHRLWRHITRPIIAVFKD